MKKILEKLFKRSKIDENLIKEFINKQEQAENLPELSDIEKVKFNQELAIDHLVNSSKIEGVDLKQLGLSKIIHASR